MESSHLVNGHSSRISYAYQWKNFLHICQSYESLQRVSRSGGLRDSPFRSVAWRILLGCLPLNPAEWSQSIQRNRDLYSFRKNKLPVNPHDELFELDLELNNPLSLQSESPWQKFFEDENIRDVIAKDINRIIPEVTFFADEDVKEILSTVLFIYAKGHPQISYRQGMHEILAPLLFVLHADHPSFEACKENNEDLCFAGISEGDAELLELLNDNEYIENDVYVMFERVMEIVGGFYNVSEEPATLGGNGTNSFIPSMLFATELDEKTKQPWIEKLDHIYNQRLKKADQTLWQHLNNLEISPRLFGMRWLRLLYGREFPFPDLLYVWDVIFSDRPKFTIISDIFVAMLVQIRNLLLHADFSTAMQFLMRYPPISDVQAFVQYCLHLHSPHVYPKPANYGCTHFAHITVAGKPHPNQDRREPYPNVDRRYSVGRKPTLPLTRLNSVSAQSSPLAGRRRVGESSVFYGNYDSAPTNEVDLMKEQIALLQSNLNDKDVISRGSAARLMAIHNEIDSLDFDADRKSAIKAELKEISSNLNRITVPELWIRSIPIQINSSQMREAVEVAKEAGSPLRPRSQSGTLPKTMRPTARSLRNENELKELHYIGRKKNF